MSNRDPLDTAKLDLTVVPPASIIHEARAMADGVKKRSAYNWRGNKVFVRATLSKVIRHLYAYLDGEDHSTDTDPPVHHLAHAKADIGVLLDALETGNAVDDRPPKGVAARLLAPQAEPTVSEREIAKAVRRNAVPCFCLDATSRRCPVPGHSDKNSTPPAISSEQDAMAEALDLPLCGKEGCHVPLHQRDPYPTRFTD